MQVISPAEFDLASLDPTAGSYYQNLGGGTFQPTLHTQGAWQEYEQHMGAVSGLITHHLETHAAREDLQLSRISFEILGLMPALPSTVTTEVIRPGRTIELLQSTLAAGGKPVVRANAWRLSRQDTSAVAGNSIPSLPAPDSFPVTSVGEMWSGGYIDSLEIRRSPDSVPGKARVWIRTDKTLIDDTPSTDLARFVGLVDPSNGLGTRVDPRVWMFPNTDLTIHLFRSPAGNWIGLDIEVTFGSSGVGLTSTTLHDLDGPVGKAEQILTVRPLP